MLLQSHQKRRLLQHPFLFSVPSAYSISIQGRMNAKQFANNLYIGMGAWRGSDFTSGHVLSLGLAQSPVHAVNVNEVKRDAISCNRNSRVKLFKEFNGCSSTRI